MNLPSKSQIGKFSFYPIVIIALAAALQIQVTLFDSPDYSGLRVNLADFALPLLGICILASLLKKRSAWPNWRKPFGYWSLALPSAALFLALINGYVLMGEWSQWALVNKFTGWFVLVAYLGAGAWIGTNLNAQTLRIFCKSFIFFFCVTALCDLIIYFVYWELHIEVPFKPGYNAQGFMYNRSAFAFLFLTAALIVSETVLGKIDKTRYETALLWVFWTLTPFCILLNGSRILWLCAIPLLLWVIIQHRAQFLKLLLPALLIGTLLTFSLFQHSFVMIARPFQYTAMLLGEPEERDNYSQTHRIPKEYDHTRAKALKDGLYLTRKHPVTGAGLGAILDAQTNRGDKLLSVMDTTLFWILIEMGPFGLFSFLLLYIVMIHKLYESRKNSGLHSAAFLMLITFSVFSLFHEILYTRFFWFILGMTLVASKAHQDGQGREAPKAERALRNL